MAPPAKKKLEKLCELVTDPVTGHYSESKLWLHPAKAAFIGSFIWYSYNGWLNEGLIWAYMVPLLAHESVSRFLTQRFGLLSQAPDKQSGQEGGKS
jgi:hypothetical protein